MKEPHVTWDKIPEDIGIEYNYALTKITAAVSDADILMAPVLTFPRAFTQVIMLAPVPLSNRPGQIFTVSRANYGLSPLPVKPQPDWK